MRYETIIENWKQGYSKKWLIEEEYKSLLWQKKQRKIKASDLKEESQRNIEEALLKWWREEILKNDRRRIK